MGFHLCKDLSLSEVDEGILSVKNKKWPSVLEKYLKRNLL